MKELSIEDKAKRYDEAIKVAADIKAGTATYIPDGTLTTDAIFPELAESEDEKIRKDILDCIHYMKANYCIPSRYTSKQYDTWIAWLEKQGGYDSIEEPNFFADFRNSDVEVDSNEDGLITETIRYKKEKQGEQNHADKVEPKFKNGQWIVWQDKCYKVNDNGCGYELIDQNGLSTSLEYGTVDENAHIWDITKDTKNGDVLALNNEVFICAYRKQMYSITVAHCFVDCAGGFYFDGEFGYIEKGNLIHPATKEQRDLLFSKMKEAGYEWDAEKKELKKIEQESTWNEKIKGLNELETYILSLVPDRSLDTIKVDAKNIRYIINKEQKFSWSEEDERNIRDSIFYLKSARKYFENDNDILWDEKWFNLCIKWLESLKDRVCT